MFRLIASYPKSGNTYVRIFLAHYLRGETDLNKVGWSLFNSRKFFPLGIPRDRRTIRFTNPRQIEYSKTHEIGSNYNGRFVEKALYIVRNPLDIVPSWARHMSLTHDKAIDAISRPNNLRGTAKLYPQKLGTWSTHVESWLVQDDFPIHFVRYESLCADPRTQFSRILEFFGEPIDETKLTATLEFTKFDNLKKAEEYKGFKEARGSTGKFFNYGKPGNGSVLTPEQTARVLESHGPMMKLLGYAPPV
jgi:hypothetical protein